MSIILYKYFIFVNVNYFIVDNYLNYILFLL